MTERKTAQMNEIELATDVLLLGGGLTGLKAAYEIAALGYKVILIEEGSEIGNPNKLPRSLLGLHDKEDQDLQELVDGAMADNTIVLHTQTRLINLTGFPGDFTVRLSKAGDICEYTVGAVVVATDFSLEALNEKYGLSLSEKVVTQSRMEALLAFEEERKKILEPGPSTIAFLVGFGQEGDPLVSERVMRSILSLSEIDGCTVYVYVDDIKVASDGLERMYKACREKGAIFFKLKEVPTITQRDKLLRITFYDPVIRRNIEVAPDLVVVEEAIRADPKNSELAELLRIDSDPGGFLQHENVHLLPVRSNREGIFVVGSSRHVQNLSWAWTDVENAVLEVKDLLGAGKKMVPTVRAVANPGKCAKCLNCYRCCPHGAIRWDNRVIISPAACQGCGICASECPMNFIQIGGYSDVQIIEEIKQCVESHDGEPRIIAFCCENSAFEAGQMAKAFKMQLPPGLHMIKVPCAGKVDIRYIMTAFVQGADGVLVMACHHGNCKSETGDAYAGLRVDHVHRLLEEIGFKKDRLRFANIASNMGVEFSSIAVDMEQRLREVGPTPLKT